MAVFEIRHKKLKTDKDAEQIGEEFDLLDAREIDDGRWLLAGNPEQVKTAFQRLQSILRHDALVMREVRKGELTNRGRLSEEEITRYRDQTRE